MTNEHEVLGLDLFDETASAVRGFPNAMLGYDKKAVDDYIRDIERQLALAKHQLRAVQRELTAANLRVDDTDFSKLGAHTANLLKVAEAQAGDILASAQARADELVAQARAEATRTSADASQTVEDARQEGLASLASLRADLEQQTATELEAARTEAEGLRHAADDHAATIVADAEQQAAALLDTARREAEQLRADADAEVAAARAEATDEHKRRLEALHAEQAAITEQLAASSTVARERSEQLQAALARASEDLRGRQQAAYAEAQDIKAAAVTEAASLVAEARSRAEHLVAQADADLAARNQELRREQEVLRQRKRALLTQLGQLSSFATQTADEFPEEQDAS